MGLYRENFRNLPGPRPRAAKFGMWINQWASTHSAQIIVLGSKSAPFRGSQVLGWLGSEVFVIKFPACKATLPKYKANENCIIANLLDVVEHYAIQIYFNSK